MDRPHEPGWNLGLRFVLELMALGGIGVGAWSLTEGVFRPLAAVLIPALAAAAWGLFNVPDDPSRSGKAPIPVPGWVRLGIELTVFAGGWVGWWTAGLTTVASIYLAGVVVHHLFGIPRTRWLVRQPLRA